MKRLGAFAPLLALAAIIGAAAYVLLCEAPRETFTAGLVGKPAPSATLERLHGGALTLGASEEPRPYVVNLFASWCGPCRAEHAVLEDLKAQGARIIGVAYKDKPENTAAFLAELGDPFAEVVLDPQGRFGLEMGVTGVPETYVVGADGRIAYVFRGPLTRERVASEILPLLE